MADTTLAGLLPAAVLGLVLAHTEGNTLLGLTAWTALLVVVHVAGPLPRRR